MHRIAIRITEQLVGMAEELMDTENTTELFSQLQYMIVTPSEMNPDKIVFKIELMSEDHMLEEYKGDPDLQIVN